MVFLHVLAGLINSSTVALTELDRLQVNKCPMDVNDIKCSDHFRQGEGICSGTKCEDMFLYFADGSNKGDKKKEENQYHPDFRVRYRYDKKTRSLDLDELRSFELFSDKKSYLTFGDNSGFIKKVLAKLLEILSPKADGPRTVTLRTQERPIFEHESTEYPEKVAKQMMKVLDEQEHIYIRHPSKSERGRYSSDKDQVETFTICMKGEERDCKCEDTKKTEKQCEADKLKCECRSPDPKS